MVNQIYRIRISAHQGVGAAQWAMGLMYEHGFGVAIDLNEALNWYKRAADNNCSIAQLDLAHMYWLGAGVEPDADKGNELCRKAAENGLPAAQYMLGRLSENPDEATIWLERAVQGGSAAAAIQLGLFCKEGVESAQARLWFERAETLEPGSGAHYLAKFYEHGIEGPKDEAKALELYQKAAEWGSAGACLALANAYQNGFLGLTHDQAKANEYRDKYASLRNAAKEKRDAVLTSGDSQLK